MPPPKKNKGDRFKALSHDLSQEKTQKLLWNPGAYPGGPLGASAPRVTKGRPKKKKKEREGKEKERKKEEKKGKKERKR